jgi:DNA polymerase III subunit delta'
MNAAELPWQTEWIASHRELVAARHHAWIVTGREGDGLQAAGSALAASILCETPKNGLACGNCGSCRWLAGDVHPDFMRLAPEVSDDEVSRLPIIKIEAAREAVEFMQLSASSARGRVLLVDPASALSRDSANALLKAIEEPPANTRWLLLAARPARLLATIRSRSLRLLAPKPAPEQATAWLEAQGVSASAALIALTAANGAPLAALLAAEPEAIAARDRFFADLARPRELPTLAWGAWVDGGAKAERRQRFALLLALLGEWVTDWARVRASLPPVSCVAHTVGLAALAPKLPLSEALRYHRDLLRRLTLPDTTLSARLQIESLLLDYRTHFSR